jgi:hypothetical protein
LFWVVVTEVPNPIDEVHHLGYIYSLASGNGIPVVGVDYLPREVLTVMRESPTLGSRRHPLDPDRPEDWGPFSKQYEGVQPPLYYLTMVPAYVVGQRRGVLGSLYAVRTATLLLALLTIPLVWMLARRLFPDKPWVWGFTSLILALLQGFNANLASITNDALLVPLATVSLLVFVRSVARPTWRGAVLCGALIGLAMLTKLNAIALVPILGLAILVLPRNDGKRSLRWRIAWGSAAVAVAGAIASTWFMWNRITYGKLSGGSDAAEELLAPLQPSFPFNLDSVGTLLAHSQYGFWQFQRFSSIGGAYGGLFFAAVVLAVAGTVVAVARGRTREGRRLGWLASCWPVAFLTMMAIVYLAYTGTIVGRHTYLALVPLLVFMAAGILLGFGRRLGAILLAALIALALWREQTELRRYLQPVYLEHVFIRGVAPVWEQPYNFGWVATSAMKVTSECPVVIIGLGVLGRPPARITVVAEGQTQQVALQGEREGMVIYLPEKPLPTDFEIIFPRQILLGATPQPPGWVRFAEEGSVHAPMAQIQCRTPDGEQLRFSQRFEPMHYDWITYGGLLGWARSWAVGGILFALFVAWVQLRDWVRTRRARPDEP